MLGLISVGICMVVSVSRFKQYDRTVNVKGLCEMEVMADKVVWPLSFTVGSDELSYLYDEVDEKNEIIVDFLKAGGIPASDITISIPKVTDKYTQEYNSTRTYRYIANSSVIISSKEVEKVLNLMANSNSLIRKGIILLPNDEWSNPISFKYEGLNDIKPEMIEKATKNARTSAEKFAEDSGSDLGKIKTASQGVFSIEDRDSQTPQIKRIRVVTSVTYYLAN